MHVPTTGSQFGQRFQVLRKTTFRTIPTSDRVQPLDLLCGLWCMSARRSAHFQTVSGRRYGYARDRFALDPKRQPRIAVVPIGAELNFRDSYQIGVVLWTASLGQTLTTSAGSPRFGRRMRAASSFGSSRGCTTGYENLLEIATTIGTISCSVRVTV